MAQRLRAYGDTQPSTTPVLGYHMPYSDLLGHQKHMWCTEYMKAKHSNTLNKSLKKKENN